MASARVRPCKATTAQVCAVQDARDFLRPLIALRPSAPKKQSAKAAAPAHRPAAASKKPPTRSPVPPRPTAHPTPRPTARPSTRTGSSARASAPGSRGTGAPPPGPSPTPPAAPAGCGPGVSSVQVFCQVAQFLLRWVLPLLRSAFNCVPLRFRLVYALLGAVLLGYVVGRFRNEPNSIILVPLAQAPGLQQGDRDSSVSFSDHVPPSESGAVEPDLLTSQAGFVPPDWPGHPTPLAQSSGTTATATSDGSDLEPSVALTPLCVLEFQVRSFPRADVFWNGEALGQSSSSRWHMTSLTTGRLRVQSNNGDAAEFDVQLKCPGAYRITVFMEEGRAYVQPLQ